MDAGALDQRISIEQPDTTTDALGQTGLAWIGAGEIWARVMESPGREFLAGEYRAEEKAVFVIRWRVIDSTWRVRWGGRVWRIASVTGTFRDGFAYLHCLTSEGAN